MNEDVEDLRKKYNQLASIVFSNNKAIHLNCKHIARLDQHVDDLTACSRQLRTFITIVVIMVNSMFDVMVVNQALSALENTVNTLLHASNVII